MDTATGSASRFPEPADPVAGGSDRPRGLPLRPPFRLRGRILTPLADGRDRYLPDGLLEVDADGRIAAARRWSERDDAEADGADTAGERGPLLDLRPWLLLPGLVDLHAHVPQLPNAGVGAGLDLLTWLERYTLPLERAFDEERAAVEAPLVFRAMAAAGTTTVAAYATPDPAATEAVFDAAEAHGIRGIIGLVLMDRAVGRDSPQWLSGAELLAASADLAHRWHGRDGGRLRYAVTPRFAVSYSAGMLAASARLARETGAHWQTHLSEDPRELEAVRAAFPEAPDYLGVYEGAGALGPQALFAHAIHLSEDELSRLVASGSAVAHCPASNLFLPSGVMPLARYLSAGLRLGLGSDVSGGPSASIFETMRTGFYAQHARQALAGDCGPALGPLAWLRLGTLEGARALGLGEAIGSLEVGKEADLIAVDAALTEPTPGAGASDDATDLVSRLIFRSHPAMVRAAWVRGRLLPT